PKALCAKLKPGASSCLLSELGGHASFQKLFVAIRRFLCGIAATCESGCDPWKRPNCGEPIATMRPERYGALS
ncbi:MAG: hypothetical protein WBZ22_04945, partial [Pseudolabrys sp.]